MPASARLALSGACLGVGLGALLLAIDGSDELAMDLAVISFVYGFAAVAAVLSARLTRLRPWVLLLGLTPLFLWAVVGTLGAGDPASALPLILYCWATVRGFKEARIKDWA